MWTVTQDQEAEVAEKLATVLTPDERQRAAEFRQPVDQTRFIVRRAALRLLLAESIHQPPNAIEIQRAEYGKPFLANHPSKIEFNLSKSNAVALIAITQGRRVGVDVEFVRPLAEMESIAERIFSNAERAVWRSLQLEKREATFFTAWTRKEAMIKAIGKGLSVPLNRVAVPVMSGRVRVDAEMDSTLDWSVQTLEVIDGYAAAVAAESVGWVVEQREFDVGTKLRRT